MSVTAKPLALVFSAALIAGCGGSSSSHDTPTTPQAKRAAPAAGGGQLKVGVTDGGIGTAARGGPDGGLRELPNGAVKGQSNTEQGVGAGASCQNTDIAPAKSNVATVVASTLCLLNGERQDKGLAPLKQNTRLAAAAVQHSQDMVDRHYFDHVAKDGSDPVTRIRKAGYIPPVGAWTVGENLAWGTGSLATPKEIVKAWMKSQGHRENMLRPQFKEIGFGVVVGNPRSNTGAGATYTTTFGGITGARAASASTKRKHTRRSSSKAKAAKPKARVAKARNLSLEKVSALVESHVQGRTLGFLGEPVLVRR